MDSPDLDAVRRYAAIVESLLPAAVPFVPTTEDAATVQVERGEVYPIALRPTQAAGAYGSSRVARLIDVAANGDVARVRVADRIGHGRPAYRPLLVYGWLQSIRLTGERPPPAARAWCESLEAAATDVSWRDGPIPAGDGARVTTSVWSALALFVAGRTFGDESWSRRAAAVFDRVVASATPGGAFLNAGPADNPETYWYHELAILHAVSSFAVHAGCTEAQAAASRAAGFHARETQPDHATDQPWGLSAFISNAEARPLADQVLHTLLVRQDRGLGGVSSILLADALYCLRSALDGIPTIHPTSTAHR